MSSFDLAIPTVLKHEGGYSNVIGDPGGQTNFGISMRWLVANNLIDVVANEEGVTHDMVIKAMSVGEADKLYKQYWWDKYSIGKIDDQRIATKLLDTGVNIGMRVAVKFLQACLHISPIDGVLGYFTLGATNVCTNTASGIVLDCFRNRQEIFYQNLVVQKPNLSQFLPGWLNRARS